jgi:hypothetical protein
MSDPRSDGAPTLGPLHLHLCPVFEGGSRGGATGAYPVPDNSVRVQLTLLQNKAVVYPRSFCKKVRDNHKYHSWMQLNRLFYKLMTLIYITIINFFEKL